MAKMHYLICLFLGKHLRRCFDFVLSQCVMTISQYVKNLPGSETFRYFRSIWDAGISLMRGKAQKHLL